jgi:RNA-directed DNA polymerase
MGRGAPVLQKAPLGHTEDAMESVLVSTKQGRIAELARIHKQVSFTSLAYHMDLDWMAEAYRRTRKDGAVGVDGQTAEEYALALEPNLRSLLERAKSGLYQAPPVRRVHIPKAGSPTERRPIGIPTFEDKVLQRAVVMLLEPLYEQEFSDCSYGFRPGRSAHDAVQRLWECLTEVGGGWVIDLDIRKFFDSMSHPHLREILRTRVCDGVLTRLIGKWLKAGVWEGGAVSYPEAGSPQGGVVSPLLSNIFLHEVLDKWFLEEVRPRLAGNAHLVRYADDAVLVFAEERDARRVLEVLSKRFAKYGLTVHPEKTRLVRFRRPGGPHGPGGGGERPQSFSFLGFTHYWGKSRTGKPVVKRKTEKSRLNRALKAVNEWCRHNRHRPLGEQQYVLQQKLRGHYAYYGITGNFAALSAYLHQVKRLWRKWLDRRSRGHVMPWEKFARLLERYPLPKARIMHSVYAASQ